MDVQEKLINNENQKTAVPQGKADSSLKEIKPKTSNSLLKKIISLLKKEELI
ncbi:hypothetical protein QFZ37_001020 [Chryseobacterium ginsenosidimutans]|uniref:hypothetical protein n=1 Tax=Chryseobacterium ginsenosidimutans TaxID=687846 RepID=UPI0027816C9C|nr:hypothetical protein [Chryseobacterium ginsenosidimutans]MDQ0592651.1 hypothetical protein [Chryseobacterium ginsenosidimutans]